MRLAAWYKALYAGLTDWCLRTHGGHDLPEYTASILLSVFASFNALSVFTLIRMIPGIAFEFSHPKVWAVISYLLILVLHYVALFDRTDGRRKKDGQVLTGWRLLPYPAASVVVTFAILYMHMRRAGYPIY